MKTLSPFSPHSFPHIRITTFALTLFGIALLGTMSPCVFNVYAHADRSAHKRNQYAALQDAPEKARNKKNPFQDDVDAVASGGKLFEEHCDQCHGRKGGGTRHGVSLLRDEVQQATPGTLFWVLTNGVVRHGMPVWSKLPEPERWQLVTFLQSLNLRPSSSKSPDSKSPVSLSGTAREGSPIP